MPEFKPIIEQLKNFRVFPSSSITMAERSSVNLYANAGKSKFSNIIKHFDKALSNSSLENTGGDDGVSFD